MNRHLFLVKHSLPDIKQDLPARAWHLSEEGRWRAARLAEILKSYQPDFLACSPEPKAVETAQIVAATCGVDFQVFEGLREHERSATPYLSKSEFEEAVCQFFEKPDTLVFGSETASQAHERFSTAVSSVWTGRGNKKIMIVSHGTVIALFVSRLTGQPGYQIWSELGLPGFIVLDLESKELVKLDNVL